MRQISSIAASLASDAMSGVGFSMGRDAWRSTKKNQDTLYLIAIAGFIVAAPFFAGRSLTRGHNRGLPGTILKTCLWNALVIVTAGALPFILPNTYYLSGERDVFVSWPLLVFTLAPLAIGLFVGLMQRPKRLQKFQIEKKNQEFLAKIGIQVSRAPASTHVDQNGNYLAFRGAAGDKLLFDAVGERGRKAFISVDGNGLMTSYSGLVSAS
ncbi:hypothetical protein QBK99_23185 [Corticibacterium sp. UT-5YL-CI-8]|nr:hypothetical protein [Tianweitania sp. UT-5YL-CI-8]